MAQIEDIGKVMTMVDMLRGNIKELEARQMSGQEAQKQRAADEANLATQQKKTIDYLTKAFEKSVNDADRDRTSFSTELKSNDQSIQRLERQIELLRKELAALRKESMTSADLKPLSDRIKKLEK